MAMDSFALEGRCGMKRIRPIAIILALASSVLLFSTGFATWYNLAPVEPPTPQSISLHSYEVVDLSDKIYTTGFNLGDFQYSSLAFAEGKNKMVVTYNIQYTGTVAFSLGYKNLSGYAAEGYQLFGKMLDGNASNQIVISFSDGSTAITVNKDNKSTYVKANNDGDYLYFEKDFATASAATTLTVTYTFNIPTNSNAGNFRQNFGKYLKVIENDKTVFVSTVANA